MLPRQLLEDCCRQTRDSHKAIRVIEEMLCQGKMQVYREQTLTSELETGDSSWLGWLRSKFKPADFSIKIVPQQLVFVEVLNDLATNLH